MALLNATLFLATVLCGALLQFGPAESPTTELLHWLTVSENSVAVTLPFPRTLIDLFEDRLTLCSDHVAFNIIRAGTFLVPWNEDDGDRPIFNNPVEFDVNEGDHLVLLKVPVDEAVLNKKIIKSAMNVVKREIIYRLELDTWAKRGIYLSLIPIIGKIEGVAMQFDLRTLVGPNIVQSFTLNLFQSLTSLDGTHHLELQGYQLESCCNETFIVLMRLMGSNFYKVELSSIFLTKTEVRFGDCIFLIAPSSRDSIKHVDDAISDWPVEIGADRLYPYLQDLKTAFAPLIIPLNIIPTFINPPVPHPTALIFGPVKSLLRRLNITQSANELRLEQGIEGAFKIVTMMGNCMMMYNLRQAKLVLFRKGVLHQPTGGYTSISAHDLFFIILGNDNVANDFSNYHTSASKITTEDYLQIFVESINLPLIAFFIRPSPYLDARS